MWYFEVSSVNSPPLQGVPRSAVAKLDQLARKVLVLKVIHVRFSYLPTSASVQRPYINTHITGVGGADVTAVDSVGASYRKFRCIELRYWYCTSSSTQYTSYIDCRIERALPSIPRHPRVLYVDERLFSTYRISKYRTRQLVRNWKADPDLMSCLRKWVRSKLNSS